MDRHGDRRSGAASSRPWRGGGGGVAAGGGPPPPRVYRVEPRDFRELVQRLTGAGGTPAAAAAPGPAHAHQRATLAATPAAMVPESRRAQAAPAVPVPGAEQFDYASWFSAPLLSPAAYGAQGFGGGGGGQHQGSSTGPLL